MKKKPYSIILDPEEQEIEDSFETLPRVSEPMRSRIIQAHKNAAKNYLKKKKSATIKVHE